MSRDGAAMTCLALTALLAVASGCDKRKEREVMVKPPVISGVTLAHVTAVTVSDHIEAVGTVRARNAARIAARIAGTVTAIYAKEGDSVPKGKLLATLASAESVAGAAEAVAAVEEARRGVDEAKARKRLADANFERYHNLFLKEAVSRQEFDNRRAEKDVADHALARAEARENRTVESSRAAGAVAGYSRITAPLAGIVTAKAVDLGMTVFPGMPLMTIEEEGAHRLEVAAPESLTGEIKSGITVLIKIDGLAEGLTGQVVEVAPTSDPLSRTFTVKLDVGGKGLRSGMYGKALFLVGERQGLFVPKSAVMDRGMLTAVWVVDRENIARLRLVKTGRRIIERVEVLAGLSAGERIVTGGAEKVVDGARVE